MTQPRRDRERYESGTPVSWVSEIEKALLELGINQIAIDMRAGTRGDWSQLEELPGVVLALPEGEEGPVARAEAKKIADQAWLCCVQQTTTAGMGFAYRLRIWPTPQAEDEDEAEPIETSAYKVSDGDLRLPQEVADRMPMVEAENRILRMQLKEERKHSQVLMGTVHKLLSAGAKSQLDISEAFSQAREVDLRSIETWAEVTLQAVRLKGEMEEMEREKERDVPFDWESAFKHGSQAFSTLIEHTDLRDDPWVQSIFEKLGMESGRRWRFVAVELLDMWTSDQWQTAEAEGGPAWGDLRSACTAAATPEAEDDQVRTALVESLTGCLSSAGHLRRGPLSSISKGAWAYLNRLAKLLKVGAS